MPTIPSGDDSTTPRRPSHPTPPRTVPTAPMACPPWCAVDHTVQRHEDDAWHASEGMLVPAAELVARWGTDERLRFDLVALQVEVVLEQRIDGMEPFVHFGVGEDRTPTFRLSLKSTGRLMQALAQEGTESPGR